jgi:hypothetical protein
MVRTSAVLLWLVSLSALAQDQGPPPPPTPAETPSVQTPAEAASTAPTPTPGTDWSMHSGYTMGEGQSAIDGEAGWPGIQTEYMYGIKPFLDLGGRFSFDYSFLGDTGTKGPGIRFQGIIRVHVFDAGKVVFSARFEPGFMTFFFGTGGSSVLAPGPSGGPQFLRGLRPRSPAQVTAPPSYSSSSASFYGTTTSITLPLSLEAGMPIQPGFLVNARVSLPLTFVLGTYGGTVLPVMLGVGTEYRLNPKLSLIADLGAGPIFYLGSGGGTDFGFTAQVGVAYKF